MLPTTNDETVSLRTGSLTTIRAPVIASFETDSKGTAIQSSVDVRPTG